jgi:hypothetical protein
MVESPFTPSEYEALVMTRVTMLEKIIDSEIRKDKSQLQKRHSICIDEDAYPSVSYETVQEVLINRYKKAGWRQARFKHEHSQDGDQSFTWFILES